MEFLKFLEGLRTPLGDTLFSLITHLGSETLLILAGLIFFWCIDKKKGYYLLSIGFLGTVINQFLKLAFRIPRPWVRDPQFTIVESARAEATGYSFPSGHTQNAVGIFGGIAYSFPKDASGKKSPAQRILQLVCIFICVAVPLSRMYLGVHTPADVGVSFLLAVILIFVVHPVIARFFENKRSMRILFAGMSLLSLIFLLYTLYFPFPTDIDVVNLENGIENAYKILGCIVALWISYEADAAYIHFETRASVSAQALKLILGLLPLLLIKSGLKAPLLTLCGGNHIAHGIRYFLVVIFAGCIWPMTFKYFQKLKTK